MTSTTESNTFCIKVTMKCCQNSRHWTAIRSGRFEPPTTKTNPELTILELKRDLFIDGSSSFSSNQDIFFFHKISISSLGKSLFSLRKCQYLPYSISVYETSLHRNCTLSFSAKQFCLECFCFPSSLAAL